MSPERCTVGSSEHLAGDSTLDSLYLHGHGKAHPRLVVELASASAVKFMASTIGCQLVIPVSRSYPSIPHIKETRRPRILMADQSSLFPTNTTFLPPLSDLPLHDVCLPRHSAAEGRCRPVCRPGTHTGGDSAVRRAAVWAV